MSEFWYYLAFTLPVALAVWALVEWRQRRRRAAQPRYASAADGVRREPVRAAPGGCQHPRFKRVYVLHDGVSVPTKEMQCVKCKERMTG